EAGTGAGAGIADAGPRVQDVRARLGDGQAADGGGHPIAGRVEQEGHEARAALAAVGGLPDAAVGRADVIAVAALVARVGDGGGNAAGNGVEVHALAGGEISSA